MPYDNDGNCRQGNDINKSKNANRNHESTTPSDGIVECSNMQGTRIFIRSYPNIDSIRGSWRQEVNSRFKDVEIVRSIKNLEEDTDISHHAKQKADQWYEGAIDTIGPAI